MYASTALTEDFEADEVIYFAELQPANEKIEADFYPAVRHDGSIWAYFTDEHVEATGEIAREVYAA